MQLQSERVILTMIIQQLNDQQRVMKIVENIDEHLHESKVLLSICRIGHNLMIFNRFAKIGRASCRERVSGVV